MLEVHALPDALNYIVIGKDVEQAVFYCVLAAGTGGSGAERAVLSTEGASPMARPFFLF